MDISINSKSNNFLPMPSPITLIMELPPSNSSTKSLTSIATENSPKNNSNPSSGKFSNTWIKSHDRIHSFIPFFIILSKITFLFNRSFYTSIYTKTPFSFRLIKHQRLWFLFCFLHWIVCTFEKPKIFPFSYSQPVSTVKNHTRTS